MERETESEREAWQRAARKRGFNLFVVVCVRVFVLGIIAHGLVISDYGSA